MSQLSTLGKGCDPIFKQNPRCLVPSLIGTRPVAVEKKNECRQHIFTMLLLSPHEKCVCSPSF